MAHEVEIAGFTDKVLYNNLTDKRDPEDSDPNSNGLLIINYDNKEHPVVLNAVFINFQGKPVTIDVISSCNFVCNGEVPFRVIRKLEQIILEDWNQNNKADKKFSIPMDKNTQKLYKVLTEVDEFELIDND